MTYLVIGVLILIAALVVSIKINIKQSKDKKILESTLKTMEKINAKTEKIWNAKDDSAKFDASLDILQEYSNRK